MSEPKKQVELPIESQLVETQISVRELERESSAKDAELETLRARVEELTRERDHTWTQRNADFFAERNAAWDRLRAVSEALEKESKNCEYCGTETCDHKHANGNACCMDCCATHGGMTTRKLEYDFVRSIVGHKNDFISGLRAIVEGK